MPKESEIDVNDSSYPVYDTARWEHRHAVTLRYFFFDKGKIYYRNVGTSEINECPLSALMGVSVLRGLDLYKM